MANKKGFQTRLTLAQKQRIRDAYLRGEKPRVLVERYCCSTSAFWLIVRGHVLARREQTHAQLVSRLKTLLPEALGWVAGIIDGEGYIGLAHVKATYLQPRIDVASTTPAMQRRLQKLLGGHVCLKKRNVKNQRDTFCWSLWSLPNVRAVLEHVLPFLIVKRKVAQVVLAFCRRRMQGKFTTLSTADERAYQAVRRLNRRGKHGDHSPDGRS